MILLSYGITKSGSTLAFELAKGILIRNGFVQKRLPEHVVARARINFLRADPLRRRHIDPLLSAVPRGQKIAVKTHSPADPELIPHLEQLLQDKTLAIHVIFRDPRDICLSLLDAGVNSRQAGRRQFSQIATLDDAIPVVQRQLERLRIWGSINGASLYEYGQFAFDMDKTIERMAAELGLAADNDAVKHYVNSVFTQKNKARRNRHADEMTPEQNAKCLDAFGTFIEQVILRKDFAWFSRSAAAA
jgi:hypothetical protein